MRFERHGGVFSDSGSGIKAPTDSYINEGCTVIYTAVDGEIAGSVAVIVNSALLLKWSKEPYKSSVNVQ